MPHMPPTQRTKPVSITVIEAIAAELDTDPLDLTPPLFDVINPESLDHLFRDDVVCTVSFEYEGHTVLVHHDGTVEVDETTYR